MKFCKTAGCPNLVARGFCDDHQRAIKPSVRDLATAEGPKVADPFYVSARWRKLREFYIRSNPLCEICGAVGAIVHHTEGIDGAEMDVNSLQTVCKQCHNKLHSKKRLKKYSY